MAVIDAQRVSDERILSPPLRPVPSPKRPFRSDVEGLRAVAVVAVMCYHAAIPHLSGGFVGVDVFFVISGYLITGQLLRELLRTKRIHFSSFYAARARRILPAAGVVLLFVAGSSLLLLPPLRVVSVELDVRDAALYVVNWHFIAQQTNYLHASAAPSPVLHFWSLSVEEQFYLAWPLLLVVAAGIGRSLRIGQEAAIAGALAVVLVVTLVLCVRWTATNESFAYLGSPSRAWEFAAGGAIALAERHLSRHRTARWRRLAQSALGGAGLVAIVATSVVYTPSTAFPGVAALVPVAGAVAVIAAGSGRSAEGYCAERGVGRLLSTRPVRAVGRLSYCLYLWHWALLAMIEGKVGPLSLPLRILVVAGSAVPAWLTARLVERPLRFSQVVRSFASCGLAVGVSSTCIVLSASLLAGASVLRQIGGSAGAAATASFGARLTASDWAAQPFGPGAGTATGGPVRPSLLKAPSDVTALPAGCLGPPSPRLDPCLLGSPKAPRLLLLGDSSVMAWEPAARAVAEDHGWSLEIVAAADCPLTNDPGSAGRAAGACRAWQRRALHAVERGPRPRLTLLSSGVTTGESASAAITGLARTVVALHRLRAPVVYLPPAPRARPNVLECLASSLSRWAACAEPRNRALPRDAVGAAIAAGRVPGVTVVDLSAALCPTTSPACPAVSDGGVLLYRSGDALTATAAAMLGPTLEAKLEMDRLVPLHLGPTGPPRSSGQTVPTPFEAPNDWPVRTSRCLVGAAATSSGPCFYGDTASRTTILLFGDSHALDWIPALSIFAKERAWRLEVFTKEGCPAPLLYPWAPGTHSPYTACTAWRANTLRTIVRGPKPVLIVLGTLNRYTRSRSALVAGWRSTLRQLERVGAPMVYLRDTPTAPDHVPTCLSGALHHWASCAFSEKGGVWPDPVATKLDRGWFSRITVVDVNDLLCPGGTCPAVIDGIELYIDQSHLTATASAALAPLMTFELDAALKRLHVHGPRSSATSSSPAR